MKTFFSWSGVLFLLALSFPDQSFGNLWKHIFLRSQEGIEILVDYQTNEFQYYGRPLAYASPVFLNLRLQDPNSAQSVEIFLNRSQTDPRVSPHFPESYHVELVRQPEGHFSAPLNMNGINLFNAEYELSILVRDPSGASHWLEDPINHTRFFKFKFVNYQP